MARTTPPNFDAKMTFLFVAAGVVCICSFNSARLARVAQNADFPNPNNCLLDPVIQSLTPFTEQVFESSGLLFFFTIAYGAGIDLTLIVGIIVYAGYNKLTCVLPSLLFFQVIRAIALNLVVFPIPINSLLISPGIPSLSATYGRTNDLFFSGHVGSLTIFFMDSIINRLYGLGVFFMGMWLYVLASLLVLGLHYTNDVVIGLATAVFCYSLARRHRYRVNLVFLKIYCFIMEVFQSIFGCFSQCFKARTSWQGVGTEVHWNRQAIPH